MSKNLSAYARSEKKLKKALKTDFLKKKTAERPQDVAFHGGKLLRGSSRRGQRG